MDWTAMGAPSPIPTVPTEIRRVCLRFMINDMDYIMRGFECGFARNFPLSTV
jgi:hypothetical protein